MNHKSGWDKIDFSYIEMPYRWRAYWKDGEWCKDSLETIHNYQFVKHLLL